LQLVSAIRDVRRRRYLGWIISLGALGACLMLRVYIQGYGDFLGSGAFMPAVMIAALFGGVAEGIIVFILSGLILFFFYCGRGPTGSPTWSKRAGPRHSTSIKDRLMAMSHSHRRLYDPTKIDQPVDRYVREVAANRLPCLGFRSRIQSTVTASFWTSPPNKAAAQRKHPTRRTRMVFSTPIRP
jgi:hypothetical protein